MLSPLTNFQLSGIACAPSYPLWRLQNEKKTGSLQRLPSIWSTFFSHFLPPTHSRYATTHRLTESDCQGPYPLLYWDDERRRYGRV